MFDKFKNILNKKDREPAKEEKIDYEKVAGIKIPPGFDASLMKKLMAEGYKSGSFTKLQEHLAKKAKEEAKKEKAKKKKNKKKKKPAHKKKPVKNKPAKAAEIKEEEKPEEPRNTTPVSEVFPIEVSEGDSSSVDILYGKPKKPLDLSKLPKPPPEDKSK